MESSDPVVRWLLSSPEPAVRCLVYRDLLGETPPPLEQAAWFDGPWVKALLQDQQPGGGFGVHPYKKWSGAHWRLVSLVELGIPSGEPRACAAFETVLAWLSGETHRRSIQVINGRTRRCASQEGNALAVGCRLGLAGEPAVRLLARSLVDWQWPDGGWNCDKRPQANHSSFYESLSPLWGLVEFEKAAGEEALPGLANAVQRGAEFFLCHHLFRSDSTGQEIDPQWLKLHYPLYWHYDILQALLILSRRSPLDEPRLQEAINLVEAKRARDGCWHPEGYYWKLPTPSGRAAGSQMEVVDWGRIGPNMMLTLNALRVLKAAGRLS